MIDYQWTNFHVLHKEQLVDVNDSECVLLLLANSFYLHFTNQCNQLEDHDQLNYLVLGKANG